MRAVIPAAGAGTRLRPHTYATPKSLLPVAGRPILDHILRDIEAAGVVEAVVVTGFLAGDVERFVAGRYAMPVRCVRQEDLEGLGAAVQAGISAVQGDDPVIVVLGDTIVRGDMGAIVNSDSNLLGVVAVDDPRRFGVVEHAGDRATRLVEKPDEPRSNTVLAGVYRIREVGALRAACARVRAEGRRTRGEYQFTDALQVMLEDGVEFRTFPLDGWYDCGTLEALLGTNRALLDSGASAGAGPSADHVVVIPPCAIADGAELARSVIGPHATVESGAAIVDSVVRDSIVMAGARVSWALLSGALVGPGAVIRGNPESIDLGGRSTVDRRASRGES